jgi:hypothetical protein
MGVSDDVEEEFISLPGEITKSRALYAKNFDCNSTYNVVVLVRKAWVSKKDK